MPYPRGLETLRRSGAVLLATAVLFIFYFWTASKGLPFGLGEAHDQHYNLMAQALLRGQLHLPVEPRPELFELTEPYEPGRNAAHRFHDASLYRGRYYLYFGVVPAVVAFVPWRFLGLGDLPEPVAAATFALAGFVFSALLLRRLLRAHLGARSLVTETLVLLVLGLTNVAPFVLRGSYVYEVAIAAGYAFSAGAAFLFASAAREGGPSLRRLALGGLLLGLAVGCRPNLVLLAAILPLLALVRGAPRALREWTRPALALLVPLAACLFLLGLYNHARFDDWTEFGARYQLVGVRPIAWFEWGAVVPTLFYHFVAPPSLRIDFPFVFPDAVWKGSVPDGFFQDSSTTGALAHSPFLLILLAALWVLRGAPVAEPDVLRRRLLVLVAAGLLVPLGTSFVFASAAMRFQVDFAHLLIVPALVVWLVLAARVSERWRRLFHVLAAVTFGWSAIVALALSLTGASNDLRRFNPTLFASLERRAEPLRVLLGRLLARGGHLAVPLRVAFPERTDAEEEPFLSWGTLEAYDVLWVRSLSPGLFSFSLDVAARRSAPPASRPATSAIGFVPGHFYDIVVDVDRVRRRVRMIVDGKERFALEGALVPVEARHVWPARGPRGHGAPPLGRFSGTLIPEAMLLAGPPGLETLPDIAPAPAILTAATEPPSEPAASGRLWAIAGRRGAYIRTEGSWRWIPCASLDRVELETSVPPTPQSAGGIEPVLVSGDDRAADALLVRYLDRGRVAIAVARWHGSWALGTQSPPLPLASDEKAVLRLVLDRPAHEVVATLGGREVLRAQVDLLPLRGEDMAIGRAPRGVALPGSAPSPD